MAKSEPGGTAALAQFSDGLAATVGRVAPSVVRVDDGTRLTATGLAWTDDGLVVSTSHGVERDENMVVEAADGARHPAELVARDGDLDVAVLHVAAGVLPAIPRASAEEAQVGAIVLALGRPGDAGLQASIGIVSGRSESETNGYPGYILHTDAALYPGFSGGALVSARGELLGMANLMFGRGRGVALGTPIVEEAVRALVTRGTVKRGYLGVRAQAVTLPDALRADAGLEQSGGLLVTQVESGSAAEGAGVLLGDTLVALDAASIEDVDDLRRVLRGRAAGDTVRLRLLRGGKPAELRVTLGAAE